MAENVTREEVGWLYEVVTGGKDKPFVSNEPGSEGDVMASYLSEHGITLVPWDIEASPEDSSSVTSVPFKPLCRSIPRDYHPEADILFTDYEDRSEAEDDLWSAQICSGDTVQFFYQWALAGRTLPRRHTCLMNYCGVHPITFPNPFLRCCPSIGWHPPRGGHWDLYFLLEPEKQNTSSLPHIAVGAAQPENARENSILYGELAVILTVMNSRVNQPKVESEEEMESLFDEQQEVFEEICRKSPAFPNEQTFPLLLFSFVGPQHARILCASINQGRLIVRMSKLYSFEKREKAPLELFMSWLFSRPAVEPLLCLSALPVECEISVSLRESNFKSQQKLVPVSNRSGFQ